MSDKYIAKTESGQLITSAYVNKANNMDIMFYAEPKRTEDSSNALSAKDIDEAFNIHLAFIEKDNKNFKGYDGIPQVYTTGNKTIKYLNYENEEKNSAYTFFLIEFKDSNMFLIVYLGYSLKDREKSEQIFKEVVDTIKILETTAEKSNR